MINLILQWIWHWFGQGLKLTIFAMRASICLLPIYLVLELLKDGASQFGELWILSKIGIIAGYIVCYVVGLAVFTAVLAHQLRDDPFRFTPTENSKDSESNQ